MVTRYNFKFRDLLGPKRRPKPRRRASSRLARDYPGGGAKDGPLKDPIVPTRRFQIPILDIIAALILVLCFVAIVVAVLWPNSYGGGLKTPFNKPSDAIDSPHR